jgi:hypothetical protein
MGDNDTAPGPSLAASSSMSAATQPPVRSFSGRNVVLGMFTFGILATSGMWVYWHLYLSPFYPLQQALADEFSKSYPRVEGGHHRHSPWTLRIVLQVPFKPIEGDLQVKQTANRVIELARAHHDLSRYEIVELYLLHPEPEHAATRVKVEFRVADL